MSDLTAGIHVDTSGFTNVLPAPLRLLSLRFVVAAPAAAASASPATTVHRMAILGFKVVLLSSVALFGIDELSVAPARARVG
jgi:hypothetical protein